MQVPHGGRDALVPRPGLHLPNVRPGVQEGRYEGMAQGIRRQPLAAGVLEYLSYGPANGVRVEPFVPAEDIPPTVVLCKSNLLPVAADPDTNRFFCLGFRVPPLLGLS